MGPNYMAMHYRYIFLQLGGLAEERKKVEGML